MPEEQTAAVVAEQTEGSAEQTEETAAVSEAEAVVTPEAEAAGTGAEAETPTFEFSEDRLREWRSQDPAFDAYLKKLNDDGFNAGRQKRDSELRREQGTTERQQAYHAWVVEELANGTPVEQLAKQTPLYVKANSDFATVDTAMKFAQKAMDGFELDEAMRSSWNEQLESIADDPERIAAVAEQLWSQGTTQAVDRQTTERIGNLTLDEVPPDSRLHSAIQAHIESEVAKELEAREMEAKTGKENPPRTPRGSASSGGYTRDQIEQMSPQQISEHWDEISPHLSEITRAGTSA